MPNIANTVNACLGVFGLRVQRVRAQDLHDRPQAFYRPPKSCQIPELASLYSLFLGERTSGVFVEVGAYDGLSFSNSSCLADVGWNGVLIEPIPAYAEACRNRYRGNERIRVIQSAIGGENSSIEITVAGPLTTTNQALLEGYRDIRWAQSSVAATATVTVPLRRLDDVLTELNVDRIDVVIVDVEGAEAAVFEGFTLERWCPRILIVELTHTHPDLHALGASDAALQRSIEEKGYSVIYKDCVNTVFLKSTSRMCGNEGVPLATAEGAMPPVSDACFQGACLGKSDAERIASMKTRDAMAIRRRCPPSRVGAGVPARAC